METMNSRQCRRLYRDDDSRILGGVCSGLAYYFNIDVVLVRVIFIMIFFGLGAGLLAYLILWVVVPPATTVEQKAEMKSPFRNY